MMTIVVCVWMGDDDYDCSVCCPHATNVGYCPLGADEGAGDEPFSNPMDWLAPPWPRSESRDCPRCAKSFKMRGAALNHQIKLDACNAERKKQLKRAGGSESGGRAPRPAVSVASAEAGGSAGASAGAGGGDGQEEQASIHVTGIVVGTGVIQQARTGSKGEGDIQALFGVQVPATIDGVHGAVAANPTLGEYFEANPHSYEQKTLAVKLGSSPKVSNDA
jgi:hypothetical protein